MTTKIVGMSSLSSKFILEASMAELELKMVGLPEREVMRIKGVRRRLKQRGYKKRYDQKVRTGDKDLESEIRSLRLEKAELQREKGILLREIGLYGRFSV
eukprot:TRINITY_DN21905_c0_g1_i1.p1 TRINITY_DN21905_c0_g1~~TRINITY_DN21905_c0_g1_i1.p1  ORF type:complete len:100 (-),score=19.80 TRINITY_DN21905_c0_g1_i1:56-355(-)